MMWKEYAGMDGARNGPAGLSRVLPCLPLFRGTPGKYVRIEIDNRKSIIRIFLN